MAKVIHEFEESIRNKKVTQYGEEDAVKENVARVIHLKKKVTYHQAKVNVI